MPALEQLEDFNRELIKLGDEPRIALKRGEEIERAMTPEEYPLDVVGPTLKTNKAPSSETETPARGAKSEGSSTDDFLSSLDPDLFSGSSDVEEPEKVVIQKAEHGDLEVVKQLEEIGQRKGSV